MRNFEDNLGFIVISQQEIDDKSHQLIGASDITKKFNKLVEENKKLKSENQELKQGKYASGLMTTNQAADYIDVKPATLRNMKSKGMFVLNRDFVITGSNRPMYKKDALDNFLNGKTK